MAPLFLCDRKFRWNSYHIKSPTGRDRTAAERKMSLTATPPQAGNPAKQDSFLSFYNNCKS